MPLDPQLQAMRDQRERDNVPPLYTMSLTEARAADLASIRESGGEPEPVHEVANLKIPGPGGDLPLRLYRPAGERPLPALLYFFGGGWVLGTIDTADGVSRSLANSAGALVAVVGYRLAPEHPFPAAIDDCYATVRWVAGHAAEIGADPARLAVGGDSAGGNLAAAVALRARADGPALAGQLLVYPNTDQLADDQSMRAADDPFLFNRQSVAWYRQHYLANPARRGQPAGLAASRREPGRAAAGARHHRRVRPAARSGRGVRAPAGRRRRPGRAEPLPGHGARVLHDGRHRRRQPGRARAGRVAAAGVVRPEGVSPNSYWEASV